MYNVFLAKTISGISAPVLVREARVLSFDMTYIGRIIDLLLSGTSLNDLNHDMLRYVRTQITILQRSVLSRAERASREQELIDWTLFVISNQEFCSPAHRRVNTVFQGGVFKLSPHIKYLRSEMNVQVFGEHYDRNVVLIRAEAADSFVDISAQYTFHAGKKVAVRYPLGGESLIEFVSRPENQYACVFVDCPNIFDVARFIPELAKICSYKPFEYGIYIRSGEKVAPRVKKAISKAVQDVHSNAQVLFEEPYDPMNADATLMRKVTFIHNKKDATRYQLVQDSASMGYRPTMLQIITYILRAGHMEQFLNLDHKTEDSIAHMVNADIIGQNGAARTEHVRDHRVLIETLEPMISMLESVHEVPSLLHPIYARVLDDARAVRDTLHSTFACDEVASRDIVDTFHDSYYRVRTLVQYAAQLLAVIGPRSAAVMERALGAFEEGRVLAVNSGMTASRVLVSYLTEQCDRVYSTEHYWETEFHVQNACQRNPHYPEVVQTFPNKLETIRAGAGREEIELFMNGVLEANPACPSGQLLCFDRSISPFFYSRTFDLERVARYLDRESCRIENPIYLVVDNTLDFAMTNASTLFPNGIPENIILVFIPSFAKLHQLGFDIMTGGMISIHAAPENDTLAEGLYQYCRSRIAAERSQPDEARLHLMDLLFFQRYRTRTMKHYLDLMVRKRQRNTEALVMNMRSVIGDLLVPDRTEKGKYRYRDPLSGRDVLALRDDKDAERHHDVTFELHYDPDTCMHAFLTIKEDVGTDRYIAGPVFEEIKSRLYAAAARAGINLADGTSWGFINTRTDWYMHTMRVAVGLEHKKVLDLLGEMFGTIVRELLFAPGSFFTHPQVMLMTREMIEQHGEGIMQLDSFIPHDPFSGMDLGYYLREEPGKWRYSRVTLEDDVVKGMVLAYEREYLGVPAVYISKAVVDEDRRGKGYLRRMLTDIVSDARDNGIAAIFLETSASPRNEHVVTSYEHLGFTARDVHVEWLDNGWPLIKVRLEMSVSGDIRRSDRHFSPIPDQVYQESFDSGSFEPLMHYLAYRSFLDQSI